MEAARRSARAGSHRGDTQGVKSRWRDVPRTLEAPYVVRHRAEAQIHADPFQGERFEVEACTRQE